MKHLKKGRKFGRELDQRHALLKSVASSFFLRGRITTTEAKAKETRPYVEKAITRAKNLTLFDRRMLLRDFSGEVIKKITEYAVRMQGRNGGYTRIIKIGARKSDSAKMAIFEFVDGV